MKLKYLLTSLLAAAAFVTACEDDEIAQLDQIKVSQSYVAIPVEGGTVEVTVEATSTWAIEDVPSWLSVDPASGSKGKSVITFSAPAATETNESILHLTCDGATQLITVLQMAEKVELPVSTCAEIIAGEDGKQYRAKGTCTAIANTTYGNWYITDETGSVYIYGTLDASGAEKKFSSLGIEVGDIVTVEGPKSTYGTTIELVNVTVISIEKSLIKVEEVSPEDATLPIEGGEFTVSLTVKGEGVSVEIPEAAKAWLSVSSINISGTAATVVFNAASNEGGDRKTDLTFLTTKGGKTYSAVTSLSQKGAIIEATAAEINAAADGDTQYRITGYVSKVANTKYGNLYIRDYTGEVYVYGTNDFAASGVEEGDIITVVGPKTSYNDAPQMKNVTVENRIDVQDIDLAGFKALEDNKEAWYRISGKVAQSTEEGTKWDLDTYGNFALTDGTTEVYIYGVVAGWGGAKGKFGELGVKEGDNLTIVAYKTSCKGLIEAAGCFYVSHEAAEEGGDDPEPEGGKYVKVTSAPSDWTGTYLIVFDSNAHASLVSGSKDLNSTVALTIADDAVVATAEVNAAAVKVAKNGEKYSMTLPDGKYFGMQHNGCLLCDSPFDIDFEYTAEGVKISGYVEAKSNTYYLYSNTNGGSYYRCYVDKTGSAGYTLPTLYKLVAE